MILFFVSQISQKFSLGCNRRGGTEVPAPSSTNNTKQNIIPVRNYIERDLVCED